MSYQIAKPSFFLSQYVKQYWAIEGNIPNNSEHIQRIVPNGLMDLILYLGDRPKSLDENKQLSENTILGGQQKAYYDLAVSGRLSLFSISFLPHAAKVFFGIPADEFFDQNIALKYIIKEGVAALEISVAESDTFEDRIRIIESFLYKQILKNSKPYELDRIINSLRLINQSFGVIDIETLASSACLSRKQYERSFAAHIGSSPKQFLRTIRFQNSIHQKQQNRNIQLTELAYSCGYYDQSHMIHDFKMLSGKTPTQYFADNEPYSDYFL